MTNVTHGNKTHRSHTEAPQKLSGSPKSVHPYRKIYVIYLYIIMNISNTFNFKRKVNINRGYIIYINIYNIPPYNIYKRKCNMCPLCYDIKWYVYTHVYMLLRVIAAFFSLLIPLKYSYSFFLFPSAPAPVVCSVAAVCVLLCPRP